MGACCSKVGISGRYITHDKDDRDSNAGDDEETVRYGDSGAIVRLHGSSAFTSMYTQRGRKGINQDAMTVWEDFTGGKDVMFCGVFDGHGPYGHRVARHARDMLPSKLSKAIKQQMSQLNGRENGVSQASVETESDGTDDDLLLSRWETAFVESFRDMDRELRFDSTIDSFCSGSTAVTVMKQGEHLVVANLGDSRAVLCTRGDRNQYLPLQLTVDQKPNIPSEAERIKNRQGRIIPDREDPDVYRIWMPDEDYPGLAMSRSFGDFCLKDYGLISIPLLSYRRLTRRDEFIVLATDGIWDVLTNKQVVTIVASTRNRSMAAKLVVKLAVREWKRRFPGSVIDDCAVICLFFKNSPMLTKSMTTMTRHHMRNHPDLTVSRSYRSMGAGKKEEVSGSRNAGKSREENKGLQGLGRINSLPQLQRLARALSTQRKEKNLREVESTRGV